MHKRNPQNFHVDKNLEEFFPLPASHIRKAGVPKQNRDWIAKNVTSSLALNIFYNSGHRLSGKRFRFISEPDFRTTYNSFSFLTPINRSSLSSPASKGLRDPVVHVAVTNGESLSSSEMIPCKYHSACA